MEVLQSLQVSDLMQREVVTIGLDATAHELAELLHYHSIGGVPVLDGEGRVAGVVSGSDLVRLAAQREGAQVPPLPEEAATDAGRFFSQGAVSTTLLHRLARDYLAGTLVRDLMTPAVFSVREEATIPELARFLLRTGAHRALVMDEDRLRGIVTATDVLRAVAGDVETTRRTVPPLELEAP
jgi:CBS domain-containing protein